MKSKLIALSLVLGFVLLSGAAIAQCTIYQLDDYTPGSQPDFFAGQNQVSYFMSTYQNGNGTVNHTWTGPPNGTITGGATNVYGNLTRTWIAVTWDQVPSGFPCGFPNTISISVDDGNGCIDNTSRYVIVLGTCHPLYSRWF